MHFIIIFLPGVEGGVMIWAGGLLTLPGLFLTQGTKMNIPFHQGSQWVSPNKIMVHNLTGAGIYIVLLLALSWSWSSQLQSARILVCDEWNGRYGRVYISIHIMSSLNSLTVFQVCISAPDPWTLRIGWSVRGWIQYRYIIWF